jgi:hypothetical protein
MSGSGFTGHNTPYGFVWGPATIERCVSDPKIGVVLTLTTPRQKYDIRVTPSGLVRINEIKPSPQEPAAPEPPEQFKTPTMFPGTFLGSECSKCGSRLYARNSNTGRTAPEEP